ncbi:hypothetical protein FHR23_000630 [Stakelama sediminis]|uniref:Uncharacterized protein n=1 Tax=Stakelama sediminis TaxID=463200 RepID=A0A840YVQ7_9SPHN|nr:hypothetical protein [Stakelama sediminis]
MGKGQTPSQMPYPSVRPLACHLPLQGRNLLLALRADLCIVAGRMRRGALRQLHG